jgi:hypothetical protein
MHPDITKAIVALRVDEMHAAAGRPEAVVQARSGPGARGQGGTCHALYWP